MRRFAYVSEASLRLEVWKSVPQEKWDDGTVVFAHSSDFNVGAYPAGGEAVSGGIVRRSIETTSPLERVCKLGLALFS